MRSGSRRQCSLPMAFTWQDSGEREAVTTAGGSQGRGITPSETELAGRAKVRADQLCRGGAR